MVSLRWLAPTLALGASSLVAAQGFDWSECDVPDFAVIDGDGTSAGGMNFCASQWKKGILINSIRAKADGTSLRGLRIGFTDNTFIEVGAQWSTDGREGTITWDPTKDIVLLAETWSTGWEGGLGRLVMETSNGQKFDAGNGDESENLGKSINRGAGMLIGLRGRHGSSAGAIDNLEFIFAKSNRRSFEFRDLTLTPSIDEINQRASNGERGLRVNSLAVVHFINKTPNEMGASIEGTREKAQSTELTQSKATTFGLSVGFEIEHTVGIPDVASNSFSFSGEAKWEETNTSSDTRGTSTRDVLRYQGDITLEPNTAARCSAFSLVGELEVKWSATSTITFEDDSQWNYESSGDWNTVESTEAWVTCEPEELSQAEEAGRNGERVEDPDDINLGGPSPLQRRQMGPVKRLSSQ